MTSETMIKAQGQALKCELAVLAADVECVRGQLLSPPLLKVEEIYSPPPTPKKPRMARFTAPFRLVRSRSQRNQYDKLEEAVALIDDRRGSDDSDKTLVETPGDLLSVLGPVIGGLQRLTPRVVAATSNVEEVHGDFDRMCENLLSLLSTLKGETAVATPDDFEVEMKNMMLKVLTSKIEKEHHALIRASVDSTISAASAVTLVPVKASSLSPADSKNPFVLHSSAVALNSRRTSVESKAIPAANMLGPPPPGQTWAMNVIRLGSFQNSALFSSSPVAVRKPSVGGVGLHVALEPLREV